MTDVQQARIEAALNSWVGGDFKTKHPGALSYWEPKMRAALAAADAVVTVEMIAEVVKGHQLGENWGDDGVGYVGCGDCGEWFGKALEGGWDRAFLHVAAAIQRLYRGEEQSSVCDCPVTGLTIVDGCEHDQRRQGT